MFVFFNYPIQKLYSYYFSVGIILSPVTFFLKLAERSSSYLKTESVYNNDPVN